MPVHLLVPTAYAAKATLEGADIIALLDSADSNNPKQSTVAGISGIPAANIVNTPTAETTSLNLQDAIDEIQTEVTALAAITGQYVGSAATKVALDAITHQNGDWGILSADDGGNQSGIYTGNGTAFSLAKEIPEASIMVGATAGTAGAVGFVPAPAAAQQTFLLSGAGTWIDPGTISVNFAAATTKAAVTGVGGVATTAASSDHAHERNNFDEILEKGATSTRAWESTSAANGFVMTDGATRWRFTVNTSGALVTANA